MVHVRRRSVDVGGLALALGDEGRGHGWGGWEEIADGETRYAEVLIDVCAQTELIVNSEPTPSFLPAPLDDETRTRLIRSLGSWHFEPHKLPEEEVLACTYILFEVLFRIKGMQEDIGVSLTQISAFLQHLRQLYRQRNTYHNFQHALDVLQAIYHFLHTASFVPPVGILLYADNRLWQPDKSIDRGSYLPCLANEDVFALCIAAVGHDVGHPGLTNTFLRNAKVPLAELYEKSTLEQMHYSLMMQLMRHHGLGTLLDRPESGSCFRKLLAMTVLATDMGIHADFMARFKEMVSGVPVDIFTKKILVCQALIKCADISNPSRPHTVSQHWAAALESEWTSQLILEEHLHLPTSVKPSKDALGEAHGQVFFTTHFTCPLLELTASGIPQMATFAKQCKQNLEMWKARASELSIPTVDMPAKRVLPPAQAPEDYLNAFPPTLPPSLLADYEHSTLDLRSEYLQSSSSLSRPSSAGSSTYSHYESCTSSSLSPPYSPLAFETQISPTQLPRLEITTSTSPPRKRAPSVSSAVSSLSINTQDATSAIRAAYKASVRKKKSFHRSSWNPSPAEYQETVHGRSGALARANTASPLSTSSNGTSPLSPHSSSTSISPVTPSSALRSTKPSNTLLSTLCPS